MSWFRHRVCNRLCFSCLSWIGFFALALSLPGCHSANINTTVSNRSATPISLIQVEYPSASFGVQSLAPGQNFKYRFKVLGSGSMKITFTDTSQRERKYTGPTLNEGSEGNLEIVIGGSGVEWHPSIIQK